MRQQEIDDSRLEMPVRAALKNEQPRRPHRNMTRYWLDHETDYYDIDDFFDK